MKPAHGTYRYWRDGESQDVVEPWEVLADGHGHKLLGQRIVAGEPVLEITAAFRDGACEALTARWLPGTAADRIVRYRRDGAVLEWSEGGAAPRHATLPDGSVLFPLLRAATGALLPQLAQGPRCVVLPDIRDPRAPGFLQPLQSQRRAEPGRDGAGHYRYYGGEYGESGADYWLDADGIVQRYRWASPQGLWEIALER